jgi:hypothetical protein
MPFEFNPITGQLDKTGQPSSSTSVAVDTKANILALSPSTPQVAFAEDTSEFMLWDGTSWNIASLKLSQELETPDMGYALESDKLGYSAAFITDKTLYNITLAGNARAENGAIRVDTTQTPNRFQVYLRGKWNTYYDDFTIANNDLRHTPLEKQIYVWRGDSIELGLNSRSIIQEYEVSMGAFPPPKVVSGGTF